MKEKTLFKLALIGIIIGLPILYYYSNNIEIGEREISKITSFDIGKDVKVSGEITRIKNIGNLTIIEITKPETITVLAFNEIKAKEGDYIDAYGTVQENNGKLEVIADIIRRMK